MVGIELNDFLQQFFSNPALAITVILTLGVIFVNGWTDAPNAIATSISTRSMGPRAAIIMAAIFNFFGVLVMTLFNSMVAQIFTVWWISVEIPMMRLFLCVLRCLPLYCGQLQHGGLVFLPAKAML